MKLSEFRATLKLLRKQCPTSCAVRVVRRPMKRYAGLTSFNGRSYLIVLSSTQDRAGQIDSLIHEWAHILAIEQAFRHEGPWGKLYAHVYDTYDKEIAPTIKVNR